MIQTVAVEKGLHELGELLTEEGYQVVSLEDCRLPVEAIIYSGISCAFDGPPGLIDLYLSEAVVPEYINVEGMTPEEAVDFIESRLEVKD